MDQVPRKLAITAAAFAVIALSGSPIAAATPTAGVGDVNSYTGQGTSGTAQNGTNATTRTGNFGPGH